MNFTVEELKNAIVQRHSVRTYIDKPIEPSVVEALNELIAECNREGNLSLQFIEEAGNTCNKLFNKSAGLGSAPSLIACVGPDDETLHERIGYYGEKIVLYAQLMGLNSCWVGTFNRPDCAAEIKENERMPIVIAIGYGDNQGRTRKCKSREDVVEGNSEKPLWFYQGVDAALLAPTAINQQRFKIRLNEDESVTITDRGGVLSKIDLGIVKFHFEVGSGRKVNI